MRPRSTGVHALPATLASPLRGSCGLQPSLDSVAAPAGALSKPPQDATCAAAGASPVLKSVLQGAVVASLWGPAVVPHSAAASRPPEAGLQSIEVSLNGEARCMHAARVRE